jgi:hypothetical protein
VREAVIGLRGCIEIRDTADVLLTIVQSGEALKLTLDEEPR